MARLATARALKYDYLVTCYKWLCHLLQNTVIRHTLKHLLMYLTDIYYLIKTRYLIMRSRSISLCRVD